MIDLNWAGDIKIYRKGNGLRLAKLFILKCFQHSGKQIGWILVMVLTVTSSLDFHLGE